eukprot:TRINITY_DN38948_c0_g1_i2.p1 TRINITY_DN38948_c0_g1~~TRINITY_DN38948_c0_g1_i2.p1  ORF type:complete len:576 (+),score=105.44 TRINITY_DN38948_c0_g1_i2:82-1809(+)
MCIRDRSMLCTGRVTPPLEDAVLPRTVSESEWVNDESADACSSCTRVFSFTCRRHHCRLCGGLFCSSCTSTFIFASIRDSPGKSGPVRTCKTCRSRERDVGWGEIESDDVKRVKSNASSAISLPPGAHDGLDMGGFSFGALGFSVETPTGCGVAESAQDGTGRASDLNVLRAELREDKMAQAAQASRLGRERYLSRLGIQQSGEDAACVSGFKMGLHLLQEEAPLGQGNYGTVVKVRSKHTQEVYALKVMERDLVEQSNAFRSLLAERTVLQHNRHPLIVSLEFSFSTDRRYYLGLEYCPAGDIAAQLDVEVDNCFSEPRASTYAAQLLCALRHLHSRSVLFRDLKPDNVLVNQLGQASLADFGLCKQLSTPDGRSSTFCGSPAYLSPEMLAGVGYSYGVDWWGLGVVLHEMLLGMPPFYSRDCSVMWHDIKNSLFLFPEDCALSWEARDVIAALLVKAPAQRLGANGAAEIQQHSFFGWCERWDPLPGPVPTGGALEVGADQQAASASGEDIAMLNRTSSSVGDRASRLKSQSRSSEDEVQTMDDDFYFVADHVKRAEIDAGAAWMNTPMPQSF